MLLQLAIGPMCLMVFNTSAAYGFLDGLCIVSAITIIDALYMGLSGAGAASVINKAGVKSVIKFIGCFVLVLFGINTISGAFGLTFIPRIDIFAGKSVQSLFIQGLILTASNPLTIVFWSSMFSAQMLGNELSKYKLFLFALGCLMSTVIFLSFIAFLGSILGGILPGLIIKILNTAVGVFLIYFGLRLLFSKDKKASPAEKSTV